MKLPALLALLTIVAVGSAFALRPAIAPGGGRSAAALTSLPPDLRALPASQLSISYAGSTKYLNLSATTWNGGTGKLHLVAGEINPSDDTQKVYQRVYNDDGSYAESLAGKFVWHNGHNHTHFDDYATYILQPVGAPGGSQRIANKTTFCIIDTSAINLSLPGAPQNPQYTSCTAAVQGLSVGWGDMYAWYLDGQEIDITGLPDGDYNLTIEVDEKGHIIESDDDNNTRTIVVRLTGDTVSILTPTPTPTITPTFTPSFTPTPTTTNTFTPSPTATPSYTSTPTATPTPCGADADGDLVCDPNDNCIDTPNAGQENSDTMLGNGRGMPGHDGTVPNAPADSEGDACETDGDADNDGIPDGSDVVAGGDITYDDGGDGMPAMGCLGGADADDDGPSWDTGCDGIRDGIDPAACAALSSSADADGDGVRERYEVCKWGTSDADTDSDADGLSDCLEIIDVSGDGAKAFLTDLLPYAQAIHLPAASFGKDGDFDYDGTNTLTFLSDLIPVAKLIQLPVGAGGCDPAPAAPDS